jgi:hypothetical protein
MFAVKHNAVKRGRKLAASLIPNVIGQNLPV